ncbi:MAG TPA: GNAT family N-acetyltransferase [Acidobacteriaceae bacterium]|nr:GNAT family N-acetyltransferase [Acidobacteriaceae bacterium]
MQSAVGVAFRDCNPGDEAAFRFLNEQWIAKYFGLEEKDIEILSDPETHILAPGGRICFALQDEEIVGCCALIVNGLRSYEVAKMAVLEDRRNQGIGRALLVHVIEAARALGAQKLTLETNSRLTNAIHLYESLGFVHLDPARVVPSPYQRADVHMEMLI